MKIRIFAALAPVLALGMAACTVEQTREGEAPEIEGGQLPQYEVEPADVDVGWDTTTVRTPDIDIRRDTLTRDTIR